MGKLTQLYKALGDGYQNTAYSVLLKFIYDRVDPTFDPMRLPAYWREVVRIQSRHDPASKDWYTRIILSELFPFCHTRGDAAATLLRYSGASLIDLALYIWKLSNIDPVGRYGVRKFWGFLDDKIYKIFEENFSSIQLLHPANYQMAGAPFADKEAYRIACLFDEFAVLARWRTPIDTLILADNMGVKAYTAASGEINIL